MNIYKYTPLFLILLCVSCTDTSAKKDNSKCLNEENLNDGLVVTVPANNRDIIMHYRRLEGPYIAKNNINSIFKDRVNIQYAGLFSYKFWQNGQLVQQEELQNDISELLKFETGTVHKVETIRTNPTNPGRQWVENYTISIESADDYTLSNCQYSAVKLVYSGSETGTKLYIPELFLDVTPSQWGNYKTVRRRNKLDGKKWPFNDTAVEALDYPNIITTE